MTTSACESSITLPQVRHVVDLGLKLEAVLDKTSKESEIKTRLISRDSATQRKGRAGRTCNGAVWRLVPKRVHAEDMQQHDDAEIRRVALSSALLRLKAVENVARCLFLLISRELVSSRCSALPPSS